MRATTAKADPFKAIADPTRRAIMDRLRAGPAPVNELASNFPQSRPAISKHLRVLKGAGLVVEHHVGREHFYELQPMPLQNVSGWLEGYRTFWLTSLSKLKRHLEET